MTGEILYTIFSNLICSEFERLGLLTFNGENMIQKVKDDKDVIWREYNDNWTEKDFKKDKEFIIKELEGWAPHIVYINGQSVLTPKTWEVRYIEPEFKSLMEG